MLVSALVELFKYKVVATVIVIANWTTFEKVKVVKQFSEHGMSISFLDNPTLLGTISDFRLQGILYVQENNNLPLENVHKKYFSNQYKWVIVGSEIKDELNHARYDSDIVLSSIQFSSTFTSKDTISTAVSQNIHFYDVYVHPGDGVSIHAWARWSPSTGIVVDYERERILRRKNLKKYPLRISAPVAHYSKETYNGTFSEYLVDMTVPDSGLRCGYGASTLLIETVNATDVLMPAMLWISEESNSSMMLMLESEAADLSAGVLRIMLSRIDRVDYVMPIWLFSVGFTYLAERESSSNMYVEPFSAGVWCCCLGVGLILALAQWLASRNLVEKEGAFMAVLATWLQQDASAVPSGLSGRWTFTCLSVCSMLVHAYYTSAIVSSLMSTGRGGPRTLRELGDSRYAIASEDHDFIRFIMFDVKTSWADLEYLKKKKLTPKFYQDIEYGVQLIQQGYTAYHAEYHQLYPYLNTLSDDEICKMQHVDTIPETITYLTTTPKGQWTNLLRSAGAWLKETGLAKRLIHRMQIHPPPCRSALLAERVTFWDVSPLLVVTVLAAIISCGLLALEIMVAKWQNQFSKGSGGMVLSYEEIDVETL